jgi:REP element-mobilizing transposase RayT
MVLGNHVIIGARGFWLPNDPRGSWSEFVGSWDLFRYGPATKTTERHSVAYRPHDHVLRREAKTALKYPAVEFTGLQAKAIGDAFASYVKSSGLVVWACAILPDHIHLVLARHRLLVEQLVIQLKGAATERLIEAGLHPYQHLKDRQGRTPKCFGRGEWKVYLDAVEAISRAIQYVEENPKKEGKPAQRWSFVVPFRDNPTNREPV